MTASSSTASPQAWLGHADWRHGWKWFNLRARHLGARADFAGARGHCHARPDGGTPPQGLNRAPLRGIGQTKTGDEVSSRWRVMRAAGVPPLARQSSSAKPVPLRQFPHSRLRLLPRPGVVYRLGQSHRGGKDWLIGRCGAGHKTSGTYPSATVCPQVCGALFLAASTSLSLSPIPSTTPHQH